MKLRFDTRDTKPKLRALRILTLLAAAAMGLLFLCGAEQTAAAMGGRFAALLFLAKEIQHGHFTFPLSMYSL